MAMHNCSWNSWESAPISEKYGVMSWGHQKWLSGEGSWALCICKEELAVVPNPALFLLGLEEQPPCLSWCTALQLLLVSGSTLTHSGA